jgi:hypothetical protein
LPQDRANGGNCRQAASARQPQAPQVVELMSVIAGDPHCIFIIPTAQHARKRRLRTGAVHDYWRTGGCADSVPAQSKR